MEEKRNLLGGNPAQPSAIPNALRALHSCICFILIYCIKFETVDMGVLWMWRSSAKIFTEFADSTSTNISPILPNNIKSEVIAARLAINVNLHSIVSNPCFVSL